MVRALAGVVYGLMVSMGRKGGVMLDTTYFGVLASLEERRDTDEAVVIIPHDDVRFTILVFWDAEGVLEHCMEHVSSYHKRRGRRNDLPSKPSLPVFPEKFFLSLEYGMCLVWSPMKPSSSLPDG